MNTSMLLIWLTGALADSMLFFGVVIAPTVFRTLSAEAAGSFLRRLFPLYFLWALVMLLQRHAASVADRRQLRCRLIRWNLS
jgi:hypothetical protein